jgi:hypothetical protein
MKQDRFLIGILAGIAVLIIVALAIFFVRLNNKQVYVDEATPEGVVHNYVLAVLNKDYQKAYGYLADLSYKPTFDQFRKSFFVGGGGGLDPSGVSIQIGTAEISADDASIQINTLYTSGDLFSSGYTNAGSAQLVKQNGAWKISSMPSGNLWDYSWYQKP